MEARSIGNLIKNISEVKEKLEAFSKDRYECHRDEDGNLHIAFDDGEKLRVPIIDLRPYQVEDQQALFLKKIQYHLWQYPRRSGKEVESWNFLVSSALETPALYLMGYPTNVRARKILWEGQITMPDGSSLKFLDMIPKRFIAGKPNNIEMTVKLTNGSVIWVVGSDIDPDKMRGINPRGVVLSEFAFCDPKLYYIIAPILRQNKGWFIGQSTFDGMNHFYRMIENNKNNPVWHCRSESIETLVDKEGKRFITDEMIEEDRKAGMPEYLIQQEYYGKVQINQETRYFAKEVNFLDTNDRIVEELILYDTPVYAAYDLGQNDMTFVTLFQMDYHFNPVIIHCFKGNNNDFDYYINEARKVVVKYGLRIRTHFGPHDADSRKGPSTKTYVDWARDMGEEMIVTRKPYSKIAAIQQMRKMLYRCKFNKENTKLLIDSLSSYEKEYDDKRQVYKDHPLHNWASDGVDSFQTMTIAIDDGLISDGHRNVIYNMN